MDVGAFLPWLVYILARSSACTMSASCRPLPLVLLARFHHNIPLPLTVSCCACVCADITADFHCLSARSWDRPEPQQGPAVLLLISLIFAPHSLSFRNGVSCRPALTSRTTRPLSRCCRSYASLHVFFHCPVQACVKTAQTLGWKARDGSDPFVGMRLRATHRLVLLQTFSKDIFRCRDKNPFFERHFFAFVVESCLQVAALEGGLLDFWTCVLACVFLLWVEKGMILRICFLLLFGQGKALAAKAKAKAKAQGNCNILISLRCSLWRIVWKSWETRVISDTAECQDCFSLKWQDICYSEYNKQLASPMTLRPKPPSHDCPWTPIAT